MSRFSWHFANDWRWLRDGGAVNLLHVALSGNRMTVSVAVTVAGLGIGLTYWKRTAREWKPAPISPTRSYAWEPIETDGWAGEPRGMEKAP